MGSQWVDWYITKVTTDTHNTYMCVFSLSIHQSLNLCLHSTFWWLWIMLLYTWVYRIFFETLLSVLLSKYSGVVLLYQIVILYLTSWRTAAVFHSSCTIFHSHQMYIRLPTSPHLCLYLLFSVFVFNSNNSSNNSMRWYFAVVLIYVSLMISYCEFSKSPPCRLEEKQ